MIYSNTLFPLNQAVYPPFLLNPQSTQFISPGAITTCPISLFSQKIGSKSEAKLAAVPLYRGTIVMSRSVRSCANNHERVT
jgi:hypothetical protein